jgi:hypothetical protein
MFDTSKALKTGRSFAEKALAFARETTVVKDFEADVKRVLSPAAKADVSEAPQAAPKKRATVGYGISQVEIYDSMPASDTAASQTLAIEISRFGVRLDLAGKGAVVVHIVDGELCFAKMNNDGTIDDAILQSVMPCLDDNLASFPDPIPEVQEPTEPEFNVTPVKYAILRRLKDTGEPRSLRGMHALSLKLCRDHGWIEAKEDTGIMSDNIWTITPAGENALAWLER